MQGVYAMVFRGGIMQLLGWFGQLLRFLRLRLRFAMVLWVVTVQSLSCLWVFAIVLVLYAETFWVLLCSCLGILGGVFAVARMFWVVAMVFMLFFRVTMQFIWCSGQLLWFC